MKSDYYVYTLCDPRDGERVLYVGMGRGKAAVQKRSRLLKEFTAERSTVPIRTVAADLTREAAFALQSELIAKYGRECDGGQLLNASLGGEALEAGKPMRRPARGWPPPIAAHSAKSARPSIEPCTPRGGASRAPPSQPLRARTSPKRPQPLRSSIEGGSNRRKCAREFRSQSRRVRPASAKPLRRPVERSVEPESR
jgi:hypothetical protein